MATTEAIFAMIGKVLGVIGMVLCMFICYFAWKVPDVARIVNENTFSSGRKRTAKFDPGFILVSMKMFLVRFLFFLIAPLSLFSLVLACAGLNNNALSGQFLERKRCLRRGS